MADVAPKTRNIVVVGCKLPHGITIQLHEGSHGEDGKPVMVATGAAITLKGRNASNVIGGHGLTDVPADFWEAWTRQNATFAPLKAGLIFAEPRRDRAMDRAVDQESARTGSEAIDPDKPGKGIEKVPDKEIQAAAAMAN